MKFNIFNLSDIIKNKMDVEDIIEPSDQSLTYSLVSNVLFFAILLYTWIAYSQIFDTTFLKFLIVFWVVRYIYSQLTKYTKNNGRIYYQLNNKVGIVVIVISVLMKQNVFTSTSIPLIMIGSYALLEILSAESFTTDIITTIVIAMSITNLKGFF